MVVSNESLHKICLASDEWPDAQSSNHFICSDCDIL